MPTPFRRGKLEKAHKYMLNKHLLQFCLGNIGNGVELLSF